MDASVILLSVPCSERVPPLTLRLTTRCRRLRCCLTLIASPAGGVNGSGKVNGVGDSVVVAPQSEVYLCLISSTLRILSGVSERGCNSMAQGSRKFLDISVGGG